MTQYEQFIAIMQSAGTRWTETPGVTSGVDTRDVSITSGSEETWFSFSKATGECVDIEVTSSHYSD